MESLYALLLGYALGSIPFGLILTRMFGAGDLRTIGSGNIGATNVLRTGRKGLAVATLLLDAGKGFLAVWLAARWSDADPAIVAPAALGALIGHCFPVWLGFRGGKGVATMLGVSLAIDWRVGLVAMLVWLVAAILTRISSLAGMCAALAAPIAAFAYSYADNPGLFRIGEVFALFFYGVALSAIAMIVSWQHRANIKRLIAGTEPKIGSNG